MKRDETMPMIPAPIKEIQFLAEQLFELEKHYQKLPRFSDIDAPTFETVVDEASKFLHEFAAPLNRNADEQGCSIKDGHVSTPDGFVELYKNYCESGWGSLDGDPKYDGQGLPYWLQAILGELNTYYCASWSNYPGLTHGVRELLEQHAREELQQVFLPKLTTGQWTGTMCLTEAHCGTDLGLLKTTAIPNSDDTYTLNGSKIFITSGDHSLTDNIIHLVLARLPDAPKGTKGISLFIVPKFLADKRNNVWPASIEHKMGLNGSATCVLNFDDATGYLIGEANKGLNIMFSMMNGARLNTGIQGMALSSAAYLGALEYAKDRLQMRSLTGAKYPQKPADPIIVHPDVRRMLLTQKALSEGNRALTYFTTQQIEISRYSESESDRKQAHEVVIILTPIVKAFMTEMGLECTNLGIQVFGGHGYISEHGMEQLYRDAKIFTLYEGTTGIQALDLLGRKIMQFNHGSLGPLAEVINKFIQENPDNPYAQELQEYMLQWQDLIVEISKKSIANMDEMGAASVDFLMYSGYVLLAFFWAQIYQSADNGGRFGQSFYNGKKKTCEFYFKRILPRTQAHVKTMQSGCNNLMQINDDEF
ncbi:Long chain acyl-CoA dehydrogenase [fadN-fadA-fadE operon] [hydrothermal vent metagenome]|uniref:Long chain acyl-CoA dehydrogenase [fadN-fadA-fadE operon] n=1 Tax=hydrothermal vent metagenome TaxID=652676 RepID=A0A3B0UVZ9_9ZZZZ